MSDDLCRICGQSPILFVDGDACCECLNKQQAEDERKRLEEKRDREYEEIKKDWALSKIHTVDAICENCQSKFTYRKDRVTEIPKCCAACANKIFKCEVCENAFYRKHSWDAICSRCAIIRKCEFCNKQFDSEKPKKFCSDVCSVGHDEVKAQMRARRWWQEFCPAGYADTDVARLPNPEISKIVTEWQFSAIGLFLMGQTGKGKTRSVYLLLKRLVYEDYSVQILRASEFQKEVINRTRPDGIGGFDEWLEEILTVDVLAVDEVEKMKFTPRVESEFFDLIEGRASHKRPMLFTTNSTVRKLAAKMSEDCQAATARRIIENCQAINFDQTARLPAEGCHLLAGDKPAGNGQNGAKQIL